jgi:hypothetical protein
MIQFEQGCTYDVAHLKPFDLQLALSGHPLAAKGGNAVRCFRKMGEECGAPVFGFDVWRETLWSDTAFYETGLTDELRLAPLEVRHDKPLHVGDEIEIFLGWAKVWQRQKFHPTSYQSQDWRLDWRWPKE